MTKVIAARTHVLRVLGQSSPRPGLRSFVTSNESEPPRSGALLERREFLEEAVPIDIDIDNAGRSLGQKLISDHAAWRDFNVEAVRFFGALLSHDVTIGWLRDFPRRAASILDHR